MGNNITPVPDLGYPRHFAPPNTPVLLEKEHPSVQVHAKPNSKKQSCKRTKEQQSKKEFMACRTHGRAIGTIHQPEQNMARAPKERDSIQVMPRKKEGMSLDDRIQRTSLKMQRKENCKEQYLLRQKARDTKYNMPFIY